MEDGKIRILVVDQGNPFDANHLDLLGGLGFEFKVRNADSQEEILATLASGDVGVVLADPRAPACGGHELLRLVRKRFPDIPVILMAENGDIASAVDAIKAGALDYIQKPLQMERLQSVLEPLTIKLKVSDSNHILREELRTHYGLGNLVGTSVEMQKIYRMLLRVSARAHPVLLLGESGTGKELVAQAIHNYGPARDKPFVPVDCSALSPTLIESELFGHVRGAFTGANLDRRGLLESARGGTILLDEIAEFPVTLQAKLLRALQEREFKPVGSNVRRNLDARIIAATNRNLEDAVSRGTFRKDLYFRLNVVTLRIPPLRERKSDIQLLARHFLERPHLRYREEMTISYDAMAQLMTYDWPGNVRELQNCIERAVALGTGSTIQVQDLPSNVLNGCRSPLLESGEIPTLKELEHRAILRALKATGGDKLAAARQLGIGKTTLYRKLKEYNVNPLYPAEDVLSASTDFPD
ncbi:MAG: sigma-54 dependent transcriptional regulator [Acidobacteria bacterium]|nr:sigma-54 dependent transcriptional regulator [Acidobacteriota bacterium]